MHRVPRQLLPRRKMHAAETVICWEIASIDHDLALCIADRAVRRGWYDCYRHPFQTAYMDIVATHANGCPLDLAQLAIADDYTFMHDVQGIHRHIDRETGQLTDCFVPRTARRS